MVFPLIGKYILEYLFSSGFFFSRVSMRALSARVPARLGSHGENKTVQTEICRDKLSCFKGNALHGGSPCTAGVCPAVLLTRVGQVSLTSGIPQGGFFLLLPFSALAPHPIQYHS